MNGEELKAAITEAITESFKTHHQCVFNEEERGLLRDFLTGANALKKTIIWAMVAAILAAIGLPYAAKFIK